MNWNPGDCGWLIEKLYNCSNEELLPILKSIETWSYGKCELHHWINVLDRFDSILEDATKKEENQWVLPCDLSKNAHMQELVVWVLYFTTLLVEHSFSRHLYSSVEHLITLLSSSSMTVILSNYITRLAAGPRQALLSRLIYLAESWGGKENGFGLAQCCQNLPLSSYPDGATTLHFEFYGEKNTDITSSPVSSKSCSSNTSPITIHINNIQSISNKSPAQIMDELLEVYKVPVEKQMILFTHLRLAHSFGRYETRLQCVQARLQAISILVYCNALQKNNIIFIDIHAVAASIYVGGDLIHMRFLEAMPEWGFTPCESDHRREDITFATDNAYTVLYSGLLDEFVDVLELKETNLTEIKAATLRTLTSIIHLERYPNFPKLSTIIDVTGASSYHGFLPVLVRSCISTLTSTTSIEPNPFPAPLATSLFSFLYHLASYEAGGEALVSCGMMESLLSVVSWVGSEPDHITFVTRAVRVIDLITNLDMNAFQNHGGLNTFIKRLELEVNECRKEQPFVIQLPTPLGTEGSTSNSTPRGTSETAVEGSDSEMRGAEVETRDNSLSPMDVTESVEEQSQTPQPDLVDTVTNTSSNVSALDGEIPSTSKGTDCQPKSSPTCLPQRAALLKSMLNFLKKDIQDPGFSESMRHLMESSLPSSLKHIISNAEYYGPSLFLLATDVVTVYVFGEPSLLSSLQDNGLTDVVLHALLVKDVPATREVLASLPNVFSALCLNSRGLQAFVACKPFERLFKVLLSPDYLPAMRRRKSSDPMGDTASNLGNAMDELMRHQPSLKTQAMFAIVKLLEEVCLLGSDTHYVCWKASPKSEQSLLPTSRSTNDNSSDEEEEEEEERDTGVSSTAGTLGNQDSSIEEAPSGDKRPVPLNLAHESGVLEQGLQCLHEKLEALAPLHEPLPSPGGSVLLRELASAQNPVEAYKLSSEYSSTSHTECCSCLHHDASSCL
ncbi:E3 ubiquitin-protein ligase HUWE1 [Armadillidium nasatum]|uniref:E3 ubiquitin-protein ligase HUWE1 n=1 Tax=Armadillidium nasatum TaxID=96803 RepID=A0A5N5TGG2_9CRUS|nr:E3 ubiquitin-protein ligase HUWE1 [Armadillidium nasatum]